MEECNEKVQQLKGLPSIDVIKNEKVLIFALNKDDRIVFADEGFIRFLEKKRGDIIGHSILEFLHHYLLGNLEKQEIGFIEFAEDYKKSHVDLDFISAKTGVAPDNTTAFAVAIKVKEGTIISPEVNPYARSRECKAAVPLLKAIAYGELK